MEGKYRDKYDIDGEVTGDVKDKNIPDYKDQIESDDVDAPGVDEVDNDNSKDLLETLKFSEIAYENPDPFEYIHDRPDPGYILIINSLIRRDGAKIDELAIVNCFGSLGYNIGNKNILNNATTTDLNNKIKEVCEKELKNTNCLIVFVMSHGKNNDEFCLTDEYGNYTEIYNVNQLIQPFVNDKALNDKPKIFIFQTCKNTDSAEKADMKLYADNSLHKKSDVLIVHSTLEGDYACRDPEYGSVFIQHLCRNISTHGMREDFVSILMRSNKCIAKGPYHLIKDKFQIEKTVKQTPLFISTLKKHFYVYRNKHRQFALNHLQRLKTIHAALAASSVQKQADEILKVPKKKEIHASQSSTIINPL